MSVPTSISPQYMEYLLKEKKNSLYDATNCVRSISTLLNLMEDKKSHSNDEIDVNKTIELLNHDETLTVVSCRDTSQSHVLYLIKALVNYMEEKKPTGMDFENVIDYLLSLSSFQGLLLPYGYFSHQMGSTVDNNPNIHYDDDDRLSDTHNFPNSASQTSLNTLEGDEDIRQASHEWLRLCQMCTKSATEYLIRLSHEITNDTNTLYNDSLTHINIASFGRMTELLVLLHGVAQAWQIYKQTRLQTFHEFINNNLRPNNNKGRESLIKSQLRSDLLLAPVQLWKSGFVKRAALFLQLDCQFVNVFNGVSNCQDSLLNHYLDCLCDEIHSYVQLLIQHQVFTDINTTTNQLSARNSTPKRSGKVGVINTPQSTTTTSSSHSGSSHSMSMNLRPASADLFTGSGSLCSDQILFLSVCDMIAELSRLEYKWLNLINSHWSSPIGVDFEANTSLKKPKGVLKKTRRGSRRVSTDISDVMLPPPMRSTLSISPVFEEGPVSVLPYLEWQSEFETIIPGIARSLEFHLIIVSRSVHLASEPVPCPILPFARDVPAKVSSSLVTYVEFVEKILPLVLSCSDENTEAVITTFNHVMCGQLQDMLHTLESMLSSKNVDILLLALSDVHLLQIISFHLTNLFQDKHEKMSANFSERRKHFSELSQNLLARISVASVDYFCNSVLHDGESHHWAEHKEFYEGQHCSFSLVFWHAHLTRLWHRLCTTLCHNYAKIVLTQTLVDTLSHLLHRYAAVKPSMRRSNQVKGDLTFILCVVESNLGKICNNVDEWLGNSDEISPMKRLHYMCMSLLQILCVLSAPLSTLHRVHTKGFYRRRESWASSRYSCTSWLTVVDSSMYSESLEHKDFQETLLLRNILLQLRLFAECVQFDPLRVLELVTYKDAYLSVLLLCHLAFVDADGKRGAKAIFTAFFRVFSHLNSPWDPLSIIFIPIVDRSNGWNCFEKYNYQASSSSPAWMSSILELIKPYTERPRITLMGVTDVWEHKPFSLDEELFPKGRLPCACQIRSSDSRLRSHHNGYMCLLDLISMIFLEILALPTALLRMCSLAQTRCQDNKICPMGGHVVFHLYLRALRLSLDSSQVSMFSRLCQLIEESDEVQPQKKMIIRSLERLGDDTSRIYPQSEDNPLAWRQSKLQNELSRVLSAKKGIDDLSIISQFVRSNIAWTNASLRQKMQEKMPTNYRESQNRHLKVEKNKKSDDHHRHRQQQQQQQQQQHTTTTAGTNKDNKNKSPRLNKHGVKKPRSMSASRRSNDDDDTSLDSALSTTEDDGPDSVRDNDNPDTLSLQTTATTSPNHSNAANNKSSQFQFKKFTNELSKMKSQSYEQLSLTNSLLLQKDETEGTESCDNEAGFHVRQYDSRLITSQPSSYTLSGLSTGVTNTFDPLLSTLTLNGQAYPHEKFMNFPVNWNELCSIELGMSELGFRSLLSHRWEFQLDANLNNDEQEMVHNLCERHHIDLETV